MPREGFVFFFSSFAMGHILTTSVVANTLQLKAVHFGTVGRIRKYCASLSALAFYWEGFSNEKNITSDK